MWGRPDRSDLLPDVVGGALALGFDENARVDGVFAVPSGERLQQLQAVGLRIHRQRSAAPVGGGRLTIAQQHTQGGNTKAIQGQEEGKRKARGRQEEGKRKARGRQEEGKRKQEMR